MASISNLKAFSSAVGGQLTFSWDISNPMLPTSVKKITLYIATKAVDGEQIVALDIPIVDTSNSITTSHVVGGLTTGASYTSLLEIVTNIYTIQSNQYDTVVCSKPSISTAALTFEHSDLRILLKLPVDAGSDENRGYDAKNSMGAKLIYNTGAGMRTYDFSNRFQADLSNNVQPTLEILDNNNTIVGLVNNSPIELTVLLYNAYGVSGLYPTISVFASDRPDKVTVLKAVSELEFNSKQNQNNYADSANAVVLFNKSVDHITSKTTNYNICRADVSGNNILPFEHVGSVAADASGNQLSAPNGFYYDSSYNFKFVDENVVLGNTYKYQVTGVNSIGEGYPSELSNEVKIGQKAQITSSISSEGDVGTVILSNIVVNNGGYNLSDTYLVDISGIDLKTSIKINSYGKLEIKGLTNNTKYDMTIYPQTTNGDKTYIGKPTLVSGVIPYDKPNKPTNLKAYSIDASNNTPLDGRIQIQWNRVIYGATSNNPNGLPVYYKLEKWIDGSFNVVIDLTGVAVLDVSAGLINYTDIVNNGKIYMYFVTAISSVEGVGYVESFKSTVSSNTIPFATPAAPASLTLEALPERQLKVTFPQSSSVGLPITYKLSLYSDPSRNNALSQFNNLDISAGTTIYSNLTATNFIYAKVTPNVKNNNTGKEDKNSFDGAPVVETERVIIHGDLYFEQSQIITDASATTFTIKINNNGDAIEQFALHAIPESDSADIQYLVIQNNKPVQTNLTWSRSPAVNFVETWVFTFNSKIAFLALAVSNASGSIRYVNKDSGSFTPFPPV